MVLMLDRIMASRDYTIYNDLIRPIVTISEDGTLGWVIAHVSASGLRFDADGAPSGPLEFVSAWIELSHYRTLLLRDRKSL